MKVIIIHGAYGSPQENWFPWLKKELEKLDGEVIVPQFPTPKGQKLDKWLEILNRTIKIWDKDLIFVAHSLGPALVLKKIEELKEPIKASFLVAGFIGELGKEIDRINANFFEKDFNWVKIRKNCQNFFVYNSDNDPYVSLVKGKELAKNLRVKLNIIHGGGHLNTVAGYTQFPKLLENIKKLL